MAQEDKGFEQVVRIPDGVSIEVNGLKASISGPKGRLEREFKTKQKVEIIKDGDKIIVRTESKRRKDKAMVGTIRAHINNAILGVTKQFKYVMKAHYRHFPMNISVEGDRVVIKNFLGEKSPRFAQIVGNTNVKLQGKDTLILTGLDKEEVGQTAANIEQATLVKGRDIRVFVDGIYLIEKGVEE